MAVPASPRDFARLTEGDIRLRTVCPHLIAATGPLMGAGIGRAAALGQAHARQFGRVAASNGREAGSGPPVGLRADCASVLWTTWSGPHWEGCLPSSPVCLRAMPM